MPEIKNKNDLADIQQCTEGFPKRKIKKVGIRGMQVPLKVARKDGSINQSSAEVSIYTNLSEETKGANMSRYRIVAEEYLIGRDLNLREYIRELLKATRERLGATDSYVKIKFDYFLINEAPASKLKSYMNYKCIIEGKQKHNTNSHMFECEDNIPIIEELYLTVQVPYTSLCPCSKEISNYGAHNQRSFADVKVKLVDSNVCWIEDIIKVVESTASAPIINGLKREDEAYQTELMYENPMFVEDMVRAISQRLDSEFLDKSISDYVIIAEHQESIHLHNCLAIITANRKLE
jgi:GTP cyclohydrolase I